MQSKISGNGCDFCVFVDYDNSNEFALYEIGNYKSAPCYSYGPVIRARSIVHYVHSGKGMLEIEGKRYEIGAGQLFYIPHGISAFYMADEFDPWTYSWLHIGGTEIENIFRILDLNADNPVYTLNEGRQFFEDFLADIFANYTRKYYCIGKLYVLADYVAEHSPKHEFVQDNLQLSYVKKVIKYIQLKYSEHINVENIAGACGLNRSYISRLFKEATGQTIQNYLLSYRMNKATSLMQDAKNTISHIAFAVGYVDIYTFSKAFKKYTGKSPSEYQKENY